jgi:hypothetical protein
VNEARIKELEEEGRMLEADFVRITGSSAAQPIYIRNAY